MIISQNIKAVIFDVDGLMINSEPAWRKTHDEFFRLHNIVMDEKERAKLRGIGLKELLQRLRDKFHLKKSIDELLDEDRKIFYKNFLNSEEMKLLKGVEDRIKSFYERGYKLAAATGGHTQDAAQKMFLQFNLLKYFSVIISSDETHRGKPSPDVFLLTAEKLGVSPSECLVLEDSVNGIKAGKAAGMFVVGVNSHEKIYNDLREVGADMVFKSLIEVEKLAA